MDIKILILIVALHFLEFAEARPKRGHGAIKSPFPSKNNKNTRNWRPSSSVSSIGEERMNDIEDEINPNGIEEIKRDEPDRENEGSVQSTMWLEMEAIPPNTIYVKMHGDLTLECQAVGSPPPMIYWLKDGKRIENVTPFSYKEMGDEFDTNSYGLRQKKIVNNFAMSKVKSKLPLRCIRPEDVGRYECVARNEDGELRSSTTVKINDTKSLPANGRGECGYKTRFPYSKKGKRMQPAYITASESLHMEAIGSDILLPCRATGKPKPKILWTDSNGLTITSGKKYEIISSGDLIIRNLSWDEMGGFNCLVENALGSDSASTFLYPLLTDS